VRAPFRDAACQEGGRIAPQRLRHGVTDIRSREADISQRAVVEARQRCNVAAALERPREPLCRDPGRHDRGCHGPETECGDASVVLRKSGHDSLQMVEHPFALMDSNLCRAVLAISLRSAITSRASVVVAAA
jgi:hypothetical protein